jgi:hypothetical protein
MTSIALRPRSGTELLDAAFQFWRANFQLLCTVVAAAFVPIVGFEMLAAADPGNVLFAFLARIGGGVFESLATAAVIVVVSERYMGRDLTAREALERVWARIGTIFATSIIYGLMVAIGILFFVAPGLYFACKYFAMMPSVVIEGYNSSTSQKRSATLTNGSKWRVLGLIIVAWIIYFILLAFASGIVQATTRGLTGIVLTRLLVVPIYPFLGILITLLYYDLRIRNEGLDLDLMMANESPTQTAPA